jgi:hypothetical protein
MQINITEEQLSMLVVVVHDAIGDPFARRTEDQKERYYDLIKLHFELEAYEEYVNLKAYLERER